MKKLGKDATLGEGAAGRCEVKSLEDLYRLQQLDRRMSSLREELEDHPVRRELTSLEEEERTLSGELAELRREYDEVKRRQEKAEAELRSVEEKLKKEEEKLYGGSVSNPKELRGLQAEVKSLRRKMDALETQAIEDMERLDELRGPLEAAEARHREISAQLENKRKALQTEEERIHGELSVLREEREKVREGIDPGLLEIYDKLLETKQGLAVVPVLEGVCQGCRVELPGKEYDRFLRSEGLFRCPNCRRILVKPE